MNLKDKVKAAKSAAPGSASGPTISGYWEKGNKEKSSWVAKITGLDTEHVFAREWLDSASIDWEGAKGEGVPRGTKHWQLQEGLYEVFITSRKDGKADRYFAAVVDDKIEKLTADQVKSIFEGDASNAP